tara:strand:+ start:473 stop:706 length:234 start_codon:yes stop_codon:yes gene_type:complete
MAKKQYLNGVLCDMPASQEAEMIEFAKTVNTQKAAEQAARKTAKTNKANALTKLKALGLTEAEISAMFAEQTYRDDE